MYCNEISVSDLTESEQQIRQTTSVLYFTIFWRYNIQLVTNCNLLITPLLPPCYRLSSTSPQPPHHLIWLYLAYILHIANIYLAYTLHIPWTYLDAILYLPKGKKVYFFYNIEFLIINCQLHQYTFCRTYLLAIPYVRCSF